MKTWLILAIILFSIVAAGCTVNNSDEKNKVDLSNCKIYYDGCNTCDVLDGKIIQCTERVCTKYGESKCIKIIEEKGILFNLR